VSTSELKAARTRRTDECLFCRSRRCHVRIHVENGMFDEVACSEHVRDLERHADRHLGRIEKVHVSSSSPLRREHPRPWVIFLVDALATGKPIRMVGKSKASTELIHQAMTFETHADARFHVNNVLGDLWEYRAYVGRLD